MTIDEGAITRNSDMYAPVPIEPDDDYDKLDALRDRYGNAWDNIPELSRHYWYCCDGGFYFTTYQGLAIRWWIDSTLRVNARVDHGY